MALLLQVIYPDGSETEADWPNDVRVPSWGEQWDGGSQEIDEAAYVVETVSWKYRRNTFGGAKVTCTLHLSEEEIYGFWEDD